MKTQAETGNIFHELRTIGRENEVAEFKEAKNQFDFDKLPDVLNLIQKRNKVRNILQKMRREGIIEPSGKSWKMSKSKFRHF